MADTRNHDNRHDAPIADPAHVEQLRKGTAAWNDWRQKQGESLVPRLSGAELTGLDLKGADLNHAELAHADLEGIDVTGANLSMADLSHADLRDAKFAGGHLIGARFDHANLSGADLSDVDAACAEFNETEMSRANLTGALLIGAKLRGTALHGATLTRTNLGAADMERAELNGAQLDGAILSGANCAHASLLDARGIILDHTCISGARMGVRATDPWSNMRRFYTPGRCWFNLVLLVAACGPALVDTIGRQAAAEARRHSHQQYQRLREAAVRLEADRHSFSQPLRVMVDALEGSEGEASDGPRVWQSLIGTGTARWPRLVILLFVVGHFALAVVVVPMRREEGRSGYTPSFRRGPSESGGQHERFSAGRARVAGMFDSYGWLIGPHRVVQILFWPAMAAFVYSALGWLGRPL